MSLLAHKIELNPNNKQKTYFSKACGVARDAYNFALAEWKEWYELGGHPTEFSISRYYNSIKKKQKPWTGEVTKRAPQQAIKNLGFAYAMAFDRIKKNAPTPNRKNPWGFPRPKKRGVHDSFRADDGTNEVKITERKISLPKIGWVRIKEPLRFKGVIKSAVVSRIADRWFVSVGVETDPPKKDPLYNLGTVGIDLGIKTMAVLSTGGTFSNPKVLYRKERHLRHLQKDLSRKVKGSKNRAKSRMRLARCYYKIACLRKNAQHQFTHKVIKSFNTIILENLNVRGMMANRNMAKAVGDVGFYEIRRQIEYKAKWNGRKVEIANRFFPSSKLCNNCGSVNKDLKLSDRDWTCSGCGAKHNRDLNAAKNLAGLGPTESSSECNVCGGESSGNAFSGYETIANEAEIRQIPIDNIENHRFL